jgi:thiamine pyrophosphate-dependent acetolactate synthase large subunit-like protein
LFGIYGRRVERDDDVLAAIRDAMTHKGPAVVDIIQSPAEGLPVGTKTQLAV